MIGSNRMNRCVGAWQIERTDRPRGGQAIRSLRQSILRGGTTDDTLEPMSDPESAGVLREGATPAPEFHSCRRCLHPPDDFREEPRSSLGLIDPDFDHAGAGDVLVRSEEHTSELQ